MSGFGTRAAGAIEAEAHSQFDVDDPQVVTDEWLQRVMRDADVAKAIHRAGTRQAFRVEEAGDDLCDALEGLRTGHVLAMHAASVDLRDAIDELAGDMLAIGVDTINLLRFWLMIVAGMVLTAWVIVVAAILWRAC